jgi:L-asparaginase/Glu-tRNA(Gln) amidotransferase subunit D
LVVLASGAHTPTVDSELIEILGVVGSGGLTAQKARVAAMIALSDGRSAEEARAVMKEMGRAR